MMGLMLAGQTYCQYPKTKVINGDTIILIEKKQADDINSRFLILQNIIDSQRNIINKKVDTPICISDCYEMNRKLYAYYKDAEKLAFYFTCYTKREFIKKYKVIKKLLDTNGHK